MGITRTPAVEPNTEFEAVIPVTKAYIDERTGKRHIVGVATGVAEDRDGERVSRSAIVGMGRKIATGVVKVTSSHQQDWMTEIGDVVKYDHDPETDEMAIDGVLPPEGVDPIADKAWRKANEPGSKLGWSIGGKLLKSYFERNELGKKRKVLDAIDLRHVMLTQRPAYQHSFAHAVAKTWDGEPPADDAFTLPADEEVEKDSTGSWASGSSDAGGGGSGRDSVGSGQRNAGSKDPKSKGMSTEDDGGEDEADRDLPKAENERHLACPNCGHEFAADLPVDPDEQQLEDTQSNRESEDEARETGKSTEKPLMTKLADTLDALKALVEQADVAKTTPDPDPTAAAAPPVTKTDEDPTDVMKMVAASHKAHEDRFDTLEERLGTAFELIAKSHKRLIDMVEEMPQGRKSQARILPAPSGHDDTPVEKSLADEIAEAPDALTALKAQNARVYGVR